MLSSGTTKAVTTPAATGRSVIYFMVISVSEIDGTKPVSRWSLSCVSGFLLRATKRSYELKGCDEKDPIEVI